MQAALLSPAQKLRIALELADTGVALHRQSLRRHDPAASERAIEARLTAWIQRRPGPDPASDLGPPPTPAPALDTATRTRGSAHRAATRTTISLARSLRSVQDALESIGAPFALVGDIALSVHTEPRFTRDVHLAVSVPDDTTSEAMVRALLGRSWRVQAQVEHEAVGHLALLRVLPPEGNPNVHAIDLHLASSGLERELVEASEPLEVLPGVTVRVATPAYLLALKVLSMDDQERPQDRIDARVLLQTLSLSDLATTRQALELITQRGYNRGKDLSRELETLFSTP